MNQWQDGGVGLLYQREDGCRAWLAFARCRPGSLTELLEEYGSAEAVYDAVCRDRGKCLEGRLPPAAVQRLVSRAEPGLMHEMMVTMRDHRIQILSSRDYLYSDALRSIQDPPAFLFFQGDAARMGERCLTVVGSRNASPRGMAAGEQICHELSRRGVTIVSGLAAGIDTAAHEGSIQGGTPGIGVMACGLDIDYPTASRGLKERLLDAGGLIISEIPPGIGIYRGSFPQRNRILSGLSRGVVLVEAKIRSGSMTTVHHALDQGREVFAWPGEPDSEWSEGAHQLLREGARYFTSADDILEDMNWHSEPEPDDTFKTQLPGMTAEMHTLLTVLHRGARGLDELALETGLDASQLNGILTILQVYGLVRAMPGKTFCIA